MSEAEIKTQETIKRMFDAVFEPREEFMRLSEASQNVLLEQLRDGIIEGMVLLIDMAILEQKTGGKG